MNIYSGEYLGDKNGQTRFSMTIMYLEQQYNAYMTLTKHKIEVLSLSLSLSQLIVLFVMIIV